MSLGLEELGRRIRQARKDADLTQRQLADLIGLEEAQSISRYERGKTEPTLARIRKIADATRKPLDFFITIPEGDASPAPGVAAQLERLEAFSAEIVRLLQLLLQERRGTGG